MGNAVFDFLILLIVVCLIAAVILWAVARFFPDIHPAARYVVGGFALIIILYALKPIVIGALP
jgi:hypothetical protein